MTWRTGRARRGTGTRRWWWPTPCGPWSAPTTSTAGRGVTTASCRSRCWTPSGMRGRPATRRAWGTAPGRSPGTCGCGCGASTWTGGKTTWPTCSTRGRRSRPFGGRRVPQTAVGGAGGAGGGARLGGAAARPAYPASAAPAHGVAAALGGAAVPAGLRPGRAARPGPAARPALIPAGPPGGQGDRRDAACRPGRAEQPARDDVGGPVHAEPDPRPADRERVRAGAGPYGALRPAGADAAGDGPRAGQGEQRGRGRVAGREGRAAGRAGPVRDGRPGTADDVVNPDLGVAPGAGHQAGQQAGPEAPGQAPAPRGGRGADHDQRGQDNGGSPAPAGGAGDGDGGRPAVGQRPLVDLPVQPRHGRSPAGHPDREQGERDAGGGRDGGGAEARAR